MMSSPSALKATAFVVAFFVLGSFCTFGFNVELWSFDCSSEIYNLKNGYGKTLRVLARKLPNHVSSSPMLFAADSIGSKEKLYAIGLCRGDINTTTCKKCVTRALEDVQSVCRYSKKVFLYYEMCTVALSNTKMKKMFLMGIASKYNISHASIQRKLLDRTIVSLTSAVAKKTAQSSNHFATGQQVIDGHCHKLFVLAQCIPTMATRDCMICLENLIRESKIGGLVGGRTSTIWCSYRFEMYHFFYTDAMLDLPAPRTRGKAESTVVHHHKHIWVIVVVAIVVVIVLIAITILIIWWVKRRSRQSPASTGEKNEGVKSTDGTSEGGSDAVDKGIRPSASELFKEIEDLAEGKQIALFLDYDGTLSPIVSDPEKAFMTNEMRDAVRDVANLFRTSIVSGWGREKVKEFVKIEQLSYAGSHGMDIEICSTQFASTSEVTEGPTPFQPASEYLELMNKIFKDLVAATTEIKGAEVESNTFCISVHYRNVKEQDRELVDYLVKQVVKDHDIILITGKMVHEIRPRIDWNKGSAVDYLLKTLKLNSENVLPIYIGDDKTDEDAFKELRKRKHGLGILVSQESRETEAAYSLRDPCQVEFLILLAEWGRRKSQT